MEDPVSASLPFATDSLSALIRPINPARLGVFRITEEGGVPGQDAGYSQTPHAPGPAIFLQVDVISQIVINLNQISPTAVQCMLVALNELYRELIPESLEGMMPHIHQRSIHWASAAIHSDI